MSLQQDIDRGLELTAQIGVLEAELKVLSERIEKAALRGPQIPLEDAERDGTQFLAKGSRRVVPVLITADYLAASFTEGSKVHEKVVQALPNREPLLTTFYTPKLTFKRVYEDGKVFRRQAREILGAELAEPFINACVVRDREGIPKNAVKIDWSRAKEMEVAA
jgi:hypothetical protein